MKKTTRGFKLIHLIIIAILALCYAIFFAVNVEQWNGTHDGATEMFQLLFLLVYLAFLCLLFKKSVRTNKYYLITVGLLTVVLAFLFIISYLFRCPYCYDGILATQ